MGKLSELLRDDVIDEMILELLKEDLEVTEDPILTNALHIVIAYYSVPGTYMEGDYDGR